MHQLRAHDLRRKQILNAIETKAASTHPAFASLQNYFESELKFTKPTMDGKASEEATRKTVMHVGKNGVMSLVPQSQMTIPGMTAKA